MKSIDHSDEVLKTLASIKQLIPLIKTSSQLADFQKMVDSLSPEKGLV